MSSKIYKLMKDKLRMTDMIEGKKNAIIKNDWYR